MRGKMVGKCVYRIMMQNALGNNYLEDRENIIS